MVLNVDKYVIGDNVTTLNNLVFYGGISSSGALTIGTTTITGGTNTKVLYNNNGVVGEYAVTNGSVVLNTSPTFVTNITTPSIVLSGAISAASWTTSGVNIKETARVLTNTTSSGTVTNTYTNVYGGNSIVSSSATTYTNYYVNYFKSEVASTGSTITNNYAAGFGGGINVKSSGSSSVQIYDVGGGYVGFGFNRTTPDNTNYNITSNGDNFIFNTAPGGNYFYRNATVNQFIIYSPQTSGVLPTYSFQINTTSGRTAGSNISAFRVLGATQTWATGTVANQYWNYLSANTAAFVGASTMTE